MQLSFQDIWCCWLRLWIDNFLHESEYGKDDDINFWIDNNDDTRVK